MSENDAELEQLRAVSCSALLERLPPPWQLDKAESTKNLPEVLARPGRDHPGHARGPGLVGPGQHHGAG